MQYPQPQNLPQLPLFQEALWASGTGPLLPKPMKDEPIADESAFSEIALRGLPSPASA